MPDVAIPSPLALLASSSEWVARSLDSILAPRGYTVLRASGAEQVVEQTRGIVPDVLVLDAALPGRGGAELCRTLRAGAMIDATTPVLITSQEPVAREARLESLRAGAWDHLVFPIDAEELLLRLEVYLRAKAAADSLRELSLVDPATGCYSARGLLRRAQELGADAIRHERAIACVTLAPDTDGDGGPASTGAALSSPEVIRRFGHAIDTQTRDSDSVGRIGQSEFVVLAPNTDTRGVLRLAERLASASRALLSDEVGEPLNIRAGCFAVPNFRDAAIDPVELMTRSTLALRQSQAGNGAERIHFFRGGAG